MQSDFVWTQLPQAPEKDRLKGHPRNRCVQRPAKETTTYIYLLLRAIQQVASPTGPLDTAKMWTHSNPVLGRYLLDKADGFCGIAKLLLFSPVGTVMYVCGQESPLFK